VSSWVSPTALSILMILDRDYVRKTSLVRLAISVAYIVLER
jgi:hypothetical protein